MSFSELLFALLLVSLVVGVTMVYLVLSSLNRRSESEAADLARRSEAQTAELSELRSQLQLGSQTQDRASDELRARLGEAAQLLEGMRSAVVARHQMQDEARQSLRRLEAVIAGGSSRGAAGENILEAAFEHLPPEMIVRNFRIKGKVCEFGFRMPGGKLMPIDSKWTSRSSLEELSQPDLLPARRSELCDRIEKDVVRRVREIGQYIDPSGTTPFALAAVPDGAYSVCRGAFAEAHQMHVLVVGYSMALPYLLALYQMHLQFSRTVDMDNLQACLINVERQLDLLDGELENRLQRAVTLLSNTFAEGRQISSRIRASVQSIQATEHLDVDPALQASSAEGSVSVEANPETISLRAVAALPDEPQLHLEALPR
ncbi:MAG: DNA recombination protein RmuC [Candidatus Dormibacteraeota bacterium]|uniref:DNA recombination protein RmuC n=1 Tax=Candidatus Dormibacter sp. TaxID=2973982 RepID=UPI000DAF5623|nr:DNA recombination protein RmuC [Candidatus Dormibacteraeota bacterium]PZR71054.1 MAG: hypothetical protein DLM66_01965 [Candidatus Dormibacteraeota bacterium]